MKSLLKCLIIAVSGVLVWSGVTAAQDSCKGEWGSVPAKVQGSSIAVMYSTDNDGGGSLRWPNPTKDLTRLRVFRAKGPANPQGDIVYCKAGMEQYSSGLSSTLLQKVVEDPQPGYYVVRVDVGNAPAGRPVKSSDWTLIQVKKPAGKP